MQYILNQPTWLRFYSKFILHTITKTYIYGWLSNLSLEFWKAFRAPFREANKKIDFNKIFELTDKIGVTKKNVEIIEIPKKLKKYPNIIKQKK